jgi:hypothetical protein
MGLPLSRSKKHPPALEWLQIPYRILEVLASPNTKNTKRHEGQN